jgi:hypothetical protein
MTTAAEEVLYAVGFEEALIGVGTQFTTPLAVYDWDACVRILMERDGMTEEEAVEYMDVNVTGAYVGAQTPIFVQREVPHGDEGPETD